MIKNADINMERRDDSLLAEAVAVEHGSPDSVDRDVVYLVMGGHQLPTDAALVSFARSKPTEDVNVALVRDGRIVEVWRGLPAELHNALLVTLPLRGASVPQGLSLNPQPRCAVEKLLHTVQWITISVRRSPVYRDRAVAALRSGGVVEAVRLCSTVDVAQTLLDVDARKQLAFVVAQTHALLQGRELYTKRALADAFPALEPHLMRHPEADPAPLTAQLRAMLEAVRGRFVQNATHVLFLPDAPTHGPVVLLYAANRVRSLVRGPASGCAFLRVSSALVVSVDPPHWKVANAALRKRCQRDGACYDEDGNELVY